MGTPQQAGDRLLGASGCALQKKDECATVGLPGNQLQECGLKGLRASSVSFRESTQDRQLREREDSVFCAGLSHSAGGGQERHGLLRDTGGRDFVAHAEQGRRQDGMSKLLCLATKVFCLGFIGESLCKAEDFHRDALNLWKNLGCLGVRVRDPAFRSGVED